MKIEFATKRIRAVHTSVKEMFIVQEVVRILNFSWSIQLLDPGSLRQKEVFLLFEGDDGPITDLQLETKPGFFINKAGQGYLRISELQFLYSFLYHVLNDYTHTEFEGEECFIPFNPSFKQLRTAYDYFLNQEGRVTKGLNRESYMNQLALSGVTHVEVNGLGFPMGLENGPKGETYPMFYTYCPAMDQFVYSELNKGVYPFYYLSSNLAYLKKNAELARKRGLIPGMLSFEPRSVPESFFQRYPMLRGARVDHPFRSFLPRYNMTITHPVVLNHYWEMTQKLLREVPDLGFFTIWSNDSGAGFEHTKSLYVGRNGGAYLVREWKEDQEIARLAGENALQFMRTILEAGREINPDFRVITRLESFYGEHETMWNGFGDGLDVETASLVAKGWEMPYNHCFYRHSKTLNGGGLHHQDLDPGETIKAKELKNKLAQASFYLGMGPEVMFAPLMGIPYPKLVWNRLKSLKRGEIENLVVYGGTFPPEKVPWFVNYEMIRQFQFRADADSGVIIQELAKKWTGGFQTDNLIRAWSAIEKAAEAFPNVSTLYNTIGFAWYRLWTRPLIPDLDVVNKQERAYYEDMMCTTPHNPNNVDLSKDVLFQIAQIDHCRQALQDMDQFVWPEINQAIAILEQTVTGKAAVPPVFNDQLVRAKALKYWMMTQRNIAAWISGVHGYCQSEDLLEKRKYRQLLEEMMDLEHQNMDLLHELFEQKVEFIALTDSGETPLMYGTEIREQIRLKQELMAKYRNVEPRIDPDYMMKKAGQPL